MTVPIVQPTRFASSPPIVSFPNMQLNSTSVAFALPRGMGQLVLSAADRDDPGVLTLLDSGSNTVASVNTHEGPYTGSVFFYTAGGAGFTLTNTSVLREATIYFQEG